MNKKDHMQLNIGCGNQRLEGFIGFDYLSRQGTDVIGDLNAPLPFADATISHIYAKSVLEHIENLEPLLGEMQRILQSEGTIYIYVPHWTNPFYYSDYTHRRFFGLASFDYFAEPDDQIYRHVPTYSDVRLHTRSVRLLFKSPFRLLHWPMKVMQWLINRTRTGQLFYEFHLSVILPCYALEFHLQKPS